MRTSGKEDAYVELMLYKGRLQLGTADALYSDGKKYVPAIVVYNHFRNFISSKSKVLMLGAGMGSMIELLTEKGLRPHYTLVELNKVILQWALEFAPDNTAPNITPVCSDASVFMRDNSKYFDLIFVDVFDGRHVPPFVLTHAFLQQCKRCMSANGHLALNYIVNNECEWDELQRTFSVVFPNHQIITQQENRILVV